MRPTPILALVGALTLWGCGASGTAGAGGEEAALVLDGRPGATHIGIYTALAREFDDAEGVKLSVRSAGADGDFVVADVEALVRRRESDEDLVAVMALVQRPPLLLAVERTTLRDDRDVVDATVAALRRGYEEALRDPELAAETVARHARVDRREVLRELRGLGASFTAGAKRFGELDRERLERRGVATP